MPSRDERPRKEEEEEKDSGVRKIVIIGGNNALQTLVYADGTPTIIPHVKGAKTGDIVLVNPQNGVFDGKLDGIELPMQEMEVKNVLNPQQVRAESQGQSVILIKDPSLILEQGDRIAVDLKVPVIIKKLPRPVVQETHSATSVTWDQIIGQDEAVRMLKEIAEGFGHAEVAEFYGRSHPKGVLFSGPPGCGKTMLAQALATALKSDGFFSMRGPEVLSKWVGESEERVRRIFESAEAYHHRTGKKAVLFIDEADAVVMKRGGEHTSIIANTLVPQFLTMMSGLSASSTFVILATNRPDALDPAVVRDGRIDKKIVVKRPTAEIGKDLMKLYLKSRPLGEDLEILATSAIQTIFGTVLGQVNSSTNLLAGHYLSGAMVSAIVEESAANAYYRNVENSKSKKGIVQEDLLRACRANASGLIHLDHSDVIHEHNLNA